MDREPGRIGFMSTQRREIRSTPATNTSRRGPRDRWQHMSCTESAVSAGHSRLGQTAPYYDASASGGTAPPEVPARRATNSLQTDHLIVKLLKQDSGQRLPGSPPYWVVVRAAFGRSASFRSSLPLIPYLPVSYLSVPALPQAPAG
jgi:hypothetical protein